MLRRGRGITNSQATVNEALQRTVNACLLLSDRRKKAMLTQRVRAFSRAAPRVQQCAPLATTHRHLASSASASAKSREPPHAYEMGTILDPLDEEAGVIGSLRSFSASTLAVVQLRSSLEGWSVPAMKAAAGEIYSEVGSALAAANEAKLKTLLTRSFFKKVLPSLRDRPKDQTQSWDILSVNPKVRNVRIGHHASNADRRFAQVTCQIEAKVVWTVTDRKGTVVGGVGSKSEPWKVNDLVVFERCISQPAEPPAWRMKERMSSPLAASK